MSYLAAGVFVAKVPARVVKRVRRTEKFCRLVVGSVTGATFPSVDALSSVRCRLVPLSDPAQLGPDARIGARLLQSIHS